MPFIIAGLIGIIFGSGTFFAIDKALEPDPVSPGQPSTATLLALAVAAGVSVVTISFFFRRRRS